MTTKPKYYHDPDGSKMRERERRIGELMAEAGAKGTAFDRAYWELVYDNEHAPTTTDYDQLLAAGFELPPADSMDDETLEEKLAALVVELDRMDVELFGAESRTPRDLYTLLTEAALREERPDVPMSEGSKWTVDVWATDEDFDVLDD
jgi:hypothetical protein